jgi:phage terminase large subunit-like protein
MSTKTRVSKRSKPLPASDGGQVCAWIEGYLVHGEGDRYGQRFRLTPEQRRFVWRVYERLPSGERRYRRVLYGRPKGYGKTELAAALALAELAGPTAPIAADIPVAAASFEQADLLFGAAKVMASEGALAPFLEVFETEILRTDGPGKLYRVAAVAGTNDGGRHTFRVCDEVHEWEGKRERVHLVLTNGLAKRAGSWSLDISTAGVRMDSLIGVLYTKGKRVEAGELADDGFLFDWLEHPDAKCDLSTEDAVRAAVKVAYRDAGDHVDLEQIVKRFDEIPEYEFRRYYLNQFTASAKRWLPAGAWEALARADKRVPAGTEVVLGFDGSYNNDSTALVGCTKAGHLFVAGVWEKPEGEHGWVVPREEVKATVKVAMERYKVLELVCDPPGWHSEVEEWSERYGKTLTVAFPTNRRTLMAEACREFFSDVVNAKVTHDGDERLARHLANAVVKETADGAYITKEHRDSPRKIDLAVAAVLARFRATRTQPKRRVVSWSW